MELLSVKKAGQQDESDAMFGPGKVLGNAWGEWWLTEGEGKCNEKVNTLVCPERKRFQIPLICLGGVHNCL